LDNCLFLKSIADAQRIRKNLVNCFEAAESALKSGAPQSEIDRLLSFVIVGAGPTGVEVAAELNDFISEDMLKHYPQFKDQEIKVQIVEMGDRVLSTYDKSTSVYTEKRLKVDDIEVLCQHQVKKVNEDSIEVLDLKEQKLKTLPHGMCVWASGVRPNDISLELAKHFGTRMLEIDASLRVKGSQGTIFALGDCAKLTLPSMKADVQDLFAKADTNQDGVLSVDEFVPMMEDAQKKYPQLENFLAGAVTRQKLRKVYKLNVGKAIMPGITPNMLEATLTEIDREIKMLPPTAQVAAQQGAHLGKVLSEVPYEELGHPEGFEPHFKYNHQGSMAYVGNHRAVIDSPQLGNLRGVVTGCMWKGAYWAKSISLRCMLLMALSWGRTHTLGRGWILGRDIPRI
jgi:NADH dehydrogenase FAD-containing subunit